MGMNVLISDRDIIDGCRNLVILMDSSGSLRDQNRTGYIPVKNYVIDVIRLYYGNVTLTGGKKLAVVQFAQTAEIVTQLGDYSDNRVEQAVANVTQSKHLDGMTNVELGLNKAKEIIDNSDSSRESFVILFISDGESNQGRNGSHVLNETLNDNYHVRAVFLTKTFIRMKHYTMRNVTLEHDPASECYVNDFDDLSNAKYARWAVGQVCQSDRVEACEKPNYMHVET